MTADSKPKVGAYPGELTTRTTNLITSEFLWNSVVSTEGAIFSGADVKNFYLGIPLDRLVNMHMELNLFPPTLWNNIT